MGTEKTKDAATKAAEEAVKAKALQLEEELGEKITPISIKGEDDEIITGYFKPASYDLILYSTDCISNKEMSKAGEAIVRGCLIPDASDKRITDRENNPVIAASFTLAAMRLMKLYSAKAEEIKKN